MDSFHRIIRFLIADRHSLVKDPRVLQFALQREHVRGRVLEYADAEDPRGVWTGCTHDPGKIMGHGIGIRGQDVDIEPLQRGCRRYKGWINKYREQQPQQDAQDEDHDVLAKDDPEDCRPWRALDLQERELPLDSLIIEQERRGREREAHDQHEYDEHDVPGSGDLNEFPADHVKLALLQEFQGRELILDVTF